MTVVAVSMFRNEADIAADTIRHLLDEGVGTVIVADNGSTDGTREILKALPVVLLDDPDPAYYQAEKMTRLARQAWELDHDCWVLPFDADEWWTTVSGVFTIAAELDATDAEIVVAYGYDHRALDPSLEGCPFDVMRWREPTPQRFPKVAFRAHPDARLAQGNHSVTRPGRVADDVLTFRHFQYRTFAQFAAKVRHGKHAYDLTDLPEGEGAHWRTYGAMTDQQLLDEWRTLAMRATVYDPVR